MLKFHNLFFFAFAIVFSVTFISSFIVSYYVIEEIKIKYFQNQLKSTISIFEEELKYSKDIERLIFNFSKNIDIAIFDTNGNNLINKTNTNLELLDDVDFISKENTLSFIKKISFENSNLYIKGSINTNSIDFNLLYFGLLISFATSIFVSLFIIFIIHENIKNEFQNIINFLELISDKKPFVKLKESTIIEFFEVSEMLKRVSKKIEKRDKKLRKYNATLKLKNRQSQDIISAISHEFKNPIAIILGYSQTLQEDNKIHENIQHKFLQKISSNAIKLSNLIDRLAIMTKLENNSLELKKSFFDVKLLCIDIKNQLENKYKDREIEIIGDTFIVEWDKILLELVIINLVENGLKYSEDIVKIKISNILEVQDNGIGILDSDIKLVTEKFYRVDLNKWNNSLGLGLSIVKYILKLHNRELLINSKFGIGSTFWFELTSQ